MEMITLTINGQTVQAPKKLLFLKPRVLPAFIFLRCAIILNLLRKGPADCVS